MGTPPQEYQAVNEMEDLCLKALGNLWVKDGVVSFLFFLSFVCVRAVIVFIFLWLVLSFQPLDET